MGEALVALRDYEAVKEAVMLQTCGRLEIYAELDDYETGVAQIKPFLANFRHGTIGYDIESYLYTLLGNQAVDHLFRVCTGLDSMLIGEAEILGQVKDAYVAAMQARSLGRTLHRSSAKRLQPARPRARKPTSGASPSRLRPPRSKRHANVWAASRVRPCSSSALGRWVARRSNV